MSSPFLAPATRAATTLVSATRAPATRASVTVASVTVASATGAPSTPTSAPRAPTTPAAASRAPTTPTVAPGAVTTPSAAPRAPTTPTAASLAPTTPTAAPGAVTTPSAASRAPTTPAAATRAPATGAPAASRAPIRLSDAAAFALFVSLVISFISGSSAPTPLYSVYQAAWGFSPVTVTVVFGVYAVAVLGTLLVAGALSDHVGRRPVLVVATAMQIVAMAMFARADGVGWLLGARIVQGVATGAAAAAVGAAMIDVDRTRGTLANAVAPMVGTAAGALLGGVLVQYAVAPTLLVYTVLGAVLIVQLVLLAFVRETAARRPGALASLRPHLLLPRDVRGPLLVAAPALVAAWALPGFYGSLGPAVVRRLLGTQSLAAGGAALGVLAASAAVVILVTRALEPRRLMRAGAAGLAAGVALTVAAMSSGSAVTFFAGAAIAGGAFGAAFQGAIRSVLPLAAPQERAGVLSIIYVIAYLAFGVPAVAAGLRVVHGGGLVVTAREYGIGVIVLALIALGGSFMRMSRRVAIALPR